MCKFKTECILSSMTKSYAILLSSTWNVNCSFVQNIYTLGLGWFNCGSTTLLMSKPSKQKTLEYKLRWCDLRSILLTITHGLPVRRKCHEVWQRTEKENQTEGKENRGLSPDTLISRCLQITQIKLPNWQGSVLFISIAMITRIRDKCFIKYMNKSFLVQNIW